MGVFPQQAVNEQIAVLHPGFGEIPRDQAHPHLRRHHQLLHPARRVVQTVGIETLGVADDAGALFPHRGDEFHRLKGVEVQRARLQRRDGSRRLDPHGQSRLQAHQVLDRVLGLARLSDLVTLVEREVTAIEHHPQQRRVDLLVLDHPIHHAFAIETVRNRIRRHIEERDFVHALLFDQRRFAAPRHDAPNLRLAGFRRIDPDVMFDDLHLRQVIHSHRVHAVVMLARRVARQLHRLAVGLTVGRKGLHHVPVVALGDQVLLAGPGANRAIGRVRQFDRVRRDREIFGREHVDLDRSARFLVREREIKRLFAVRVGFAQFRVRNRPVLFQHGDFDQRLALEILRLDRVLDP